MLLSHRKEINGLWICVHLSCLHCTNVQKLYLSFYSRAFALARTSKYYEILGQLVYPERNMDQRNTRNVLYSVTFRIFAILLGDRRTATEMNELFTYSGENFPAARSKAIHWVIIRLCRFYRVYNSPSRLFMDCGKKTLHHRPPGAT